jgi:hypothetical protein
MKINIKNVSGLITYISENSAWSPVTVSNVVSALGYRKNGGLESLKELSSYLLSCAKHGADCGFHGFTMYYETVKFFRENRKDIIRNLQQCADECGVRVIELVKNFGIYRRQQPPEAEKIGCAIYSQHINDDLWDLYNLFSWFCLESVSNIWADYLENNYQFKVSISA